MGAKLQHFECEDLPAESYFHLVTDSQIGSGFCRPAVYFHAPFVAQFLGECASFDHACHFQEFVQPHFIHPRSSVSLPVCGLHVWSPSSSRALFRRIPSHPLSSLFCLPFSWHRSIYASGLPLIPPIDRKSVV